jgi:anhydro-N-acetylmuramic acid kinase
MQTMPVLAIGLMSGTSMDGIDASLITTDGKESVRPIAFITHPYPAALQNRIREAVALAQQLCAPAPQHTPFAELIQDLTHAHAKAVHALLHQAGLCASAIALVGFHGQTLVHRPQQRWTWQAGDGALLARLTAISVISDFRSHDVAAGGQGAPLVPLYHEALVRQAGLACPIGILNIGGVANLTYVGEAHNALLAFDTGPGNALLDDWMLKHTGVPLDAGGRVAALGLVDQARLEAFCQHPYFQKPAPKSLDRHDFSLSLIEGLSLEDGAATLCAMTARSVGLAEQRLPKPVRQWLVTGGGRHNTTLMGMLEQNLQAPVAPVEQCGWHGDALEADAFAYLALRARAGLPLSLPATTGVPQPLSGGVWHAAA